MRLSTSTLTRSLIILMFLQLLLIVGCSPTKETYKVQKYNSTGIGKVSKIVILSTIFLNVDDTEIEITASKCLSKSFMKYKKKLNLYQSHEFRKMIFSRVDEDCDGVSNQIFCFVNKPYLAEMINSLKIRYVIFITPTNYQDDRIEGYSWGGGSPGGTFFIVGGKKFKGTTFRYNIYDVKQSNKKSGSIELKCRGYEHIGCMTGIPFYLPVETKDTACNLFGDITAKFIIEPEIHSIKDEMDSYAEPPNTVEDPQQTHQSI